MTSKAKYKTPTTNELQQGRTKLFRMTTGGETTPQTEDGVDLLPFKSQPGLHPSDVPPPTITDTAPTTDEMTSPTSSRLARSKDPFSPPPSHAHQALEQVPPTLQAPTKPDPPKGSPPPPGTPYTNRHKPPAASVAETALPPSGKQPPNIW
ncbi:LOW QUALITY PROTEIN: hypothetical protein CVT26_015910 [Gymnopilus dilepis]|uniref:Uncharacterized protein n=1 Tax=Gymnopilus dilepis TaxID=231916 RepID=A0A409WAG6_9AGAR|nr:LOW QUALITY PROTEIN: hypothetical protein CVT26_015910 [Gymnopilus dilepis]